MLYDSNAITIHWVNLKVKHKLCSKVRHWPPPNPGFDSKLLICWLGNHVDWGVNLEYGDNICQKFIYFRFILAYSVKVSDKVKPVGDSFISDQRCFACICNTSHRWSKDINNIFGQFDPNKKTLRNEMISIWNFQILTGWFKIMRNKWCIKNSDFLEI